MIANGKSPAYEGLTSLIASIIGAMAKGFGIIIGVYLGLRFLGLFGAHLHFLGS